MNWKIGKRKKNYHFTEEKFRESTDVLRSPERGFYTIYTFFADQKPDFDELTWSLVGEERIALVIWDIGAFRTEELKKEALSDIGKVLSFFKEHEYDVIFRPVYDRLGHGKEREPETFSLVLKHLAQIGQLLEKGEHSVFLFQGFLVGSWGEMHTSAYLTDGHLRQMYSCIAPYLSDRIQLAVRTPAQWRTLVPEKGYEKQTAIGLFDDAILGSGTHLGTFGTQMRSAAGWTGSWCRMEELQFINKICRHVFCGGEVISGSEVNAKSVLMELRRMHVSYLNRNHDRALFEQFRAMPLSEEYGIWTGKSLFDYIEAHLGYRFVIRSANGKEEKGGRMQLSVTIENTGFAPLYAPVRLFLITGDGQDEKKKEILDTFGLSDLMPGESAVLETVLIPEEGKVRLCAKRAGDGAPVFFCNQNTSENGALLGTVIEE